MVSIDVEMRKEKTKTTQRNIGGTHQQDEKMEPFSYIRARYLEQVVYRNPFKHRAFKFDKLVRDYDGEQRVRL